MDKSEDLKTKAATDDLIRVIGRQAVRIAELEAENNSIRVNPGPQLSREKRVEPSPDRAPSDTTKIPSISIQTYEQLSHKYAELLARHEQLETHFAVRESKYREAKNVVKQWKAYVDQKFPRVSRSRSPSKPPKLVQGLDYGPGLENQDDTNIETRNTPDPTSEINDVGVCETDAALPEYPNRDIAAEVQHVTAEPTKARRRSVQVTSSQTTESLDELEDTPRAAIKREPSSDDSPVVVSTRQLKRKASPSLQTTTAQRIKREPTSPGGRIEFNSQNYSSPPLPPQPLHQHDTSDLNDIGLRLSTPRKPRHAVEVEQRASSKCTALRPWPTASHSTPSANGNQHSRKETPVESTTEARPNGQYARHIMASSDHGTSHAQAPGSPSGTALQQRSVNLPAPRPIRRALEASRKNPKQGNAASENPHAGVGDGGDARRRAENIERSPEQVRNIKQENDEEGGGQPPAAARRLDALLADHTPPARTPLASGGGGDTRPSAAASASASAAANNARRARLLPPPVESTPEPSADKRSDPSDRTKAARTARGSRESSSASSPLPPPRKASSTTPLRSRPLSALQLEDFKINARYLGTDFAYKEERNDASSSSRGREHRRGLLDTCTRPGCCGETFRRVVEAGGTSVSGKSDAVALEEFLGPGWEGEVEGLGPGERRELLVRAHVHCFARQHGRHRHAFGRRSTPPGFWRTDMPTTQEEEDDRARARRAGRQKVEERWREARRDGGMWLFRDE